MPGRAYRVTYKHGGILQAAITHTADAAGIISITGFTQGTYDGFDLADPDIGCTSGELSGVTVVLTD